MSTAVVFAINDGSLSDLKCESRGITPRFCTPEQAVRCTQRKGYGFPKARKTVRRGAAMRRKPRGGTVKCSENVPPLVWLILLNQQVRMYDPSSSVPRN